MGAKIGIECREIKMLIAVQNLSTMVSDADVATMVAAIDVQLRLQFLPAWRTNSVSIQFFAKGTAIPGYAWVLDVIDNDASVPGALGYHSEDGDKIDGYIMAQPVLTNGGVPLIFDPTNPGRYTVAATLSHEVCETIADRFVNLYADNGNTSWAVEVCDPVESVSYGVGVNGVVVAMSDFVFPNFFNQEATASNAPFSFMKSVSAPFTLASGGYAVVRTGGPGTEQQIYGKSMPKWRRDQKRSEFSRAYKRSGIGKSFWGRLSRALF
jgi:hypothetical protein